MTNQETKWYKEFLASEQPSLDAIKEAKNRLERTAKVLVKWNIRKLTSDKALSQIVGILDVSFDNEWRKTH